MSKRDPLDPKGLMADAYRIDGITASECRSIFLDWALGVPAGDNMQTQIKAILARHNDQPEEHPMTVTLRAGLTPAQTPRRRGGRAARLSS